MNTDIQYNEDGKILAETPYVGMRKHGTAKIYHPNGEVFCTYEFRYGQENGECKYYFDDGQINLRVCLVNNVLNGKCICWNRSGEEVILGYFNNGKKILTWKYRQADGKIKKVRYS